MRGFKKDGKFRPTGNRTKSSLKKSDVVRKKKSVDSKNWFKGHHEDAVSEADIEEEAKDYFDSLPKSMIDLDKYHALQNYLNGQFGSNPRDESYLNGLANDIVYEEQQAQFEKEEHARYLEEERYYKENNTSEAEEFEKYFKEHPDEARSKESLDSEPNIGDIAKVSKGNGINSGKIVKVIRSNNDFGDNFEVKVIKPEIMEGVTLVIPKDGFEAPRDKKTIEVDQTIGQKHRADKAKREGTHEHEGFNKLVKDIEKGDKSLSEESAKNIAGSIQAKSKKKFGTKTVSKGGKKHIEPAI